MIAGSFLGRQLAMAIFRHTEKGRGSSLSAIDPPVPGRTAKIRYLFPRRPHLLCRHIAERGPRLEALVGTTVTSTDEAA